jgi:hypothetical protein
MKVLVTLFEKNPFQEGIFVSEHKTFVRGTSMALLKTLQILFVELDGALQLFDVLCPALSEGSLSLSVPLLSFFRCCVNLVSRSKY